MDARAPPVAVLRVYGMQATVAAVYMHTMTKPEGSSGSGRRYSMFVGCRHVAGQIQSTEHVEHAAELRTV